MASQREGHSVNDDTSYPSNHTLDALIATHLFQWQGVRWHQDLRTYVGMLPGGTTETVVPAYTSDRAQRRGLIRRLIDRGYTLSFELVEGLPEIGARITLRGQSSHTASGQTVPEALCRAFWLALEADDVL
ncbi:MAG: hypothetical protein V3R80_12740 [Candidatus Tectomicrobia bacterium]